MITILESGVEVSEPLSDVLHVFAGGQANAFGIGQRAHTVDTATSASAAISCNVTARAPGFADGVRFPRPFIVAAMRATACDRGVATE